jgi:hypothetical protein
MAAKRDRKVRITVSLPKPLYEDACSVIRSNATSAESMNGFIVAAVGAYVKLFKRRRIDAGFRAMAGDAAYKKEAELISEEFSASDWEALNLAEAGE